MLTKFVFPTFIFYLFCLIHGTGRQAGQTIRQWRWWCGWWQKYWISNPLVCHQVETAAVQSVVHPPTSNQWIIDVRKTTINKTWWWWHSLLGTGYKDDGCGMWYADPLSWIMLTGHPARGCEVEEAIYRLCFDRLWFWLLLCVVGRCLLEGWLACPSCWLVRLSCRILLARGRRRRLSFVVASSHSLATKLRFQS